MPGKTRPPSETRSTPGRTSSRRVQLTSSDQLLRQIVAAGDVLPWDWDIKLDRFRWAAAPDWLLGAPNAENGGYADLRDIVHADDRERFLAAAQAAKERLLPFQLEMRVVAGGGKTRNVFLRGRSYAETGIEPTHISGVIIEITRQMPAASAHDAFAVQQRALLDNLPDIAWLKDAKGCLISVNLAFSKRYGIACEDAPGKTDFDIYPRDKAAQLRREDNEVIATRTPMRYESSQEFDGKQFWVEILKAPMFDAAGTVIGTVGTSRDISARKVAERQLLDSERRFRMLAEMSSDWYWEQDAEFRFTSITSRPNKNIDFKALIGKQRWELPGMDATLAFWRTHRATLDAHLPFHDFEYTTVQANGAQRRFLVSGKPVYDESGKFAGYRGIGTDITERRAAEAELRLAKERLELALQGSRLALWDTNLTTGEVYLSEAWSRMRGLAAGETHTSTAELMKLVHPDDLQDAHQRSMETVRGERDEYMTEHRVRAADGSWRWIISRGRVSARDAAGRALRMSGTNLDITERKEMETSLGAALNRSEVLLQTTPTAIALVSDGVIRRCNPAMERLFGAAPGALYGASTRVLFPGEDDWQAATAKSRDAITRGETVNEQFEFVRADGERFWAMVAARELEPGSSDILFTYTDVTAQQNLLRALVRAKELADAASQSKSSFLATMSHEIRTPMNGVLGMLELLGFSSLDKEQRESLDLARQSAVALLRLIDDILDFSKIEAGQLEICAEPASLAALVNRAAAVYSEVATRKGLLLEHRVDPAIAPAHMADGLRLTQIMNNLLSNAIKFTTRGKVSLEIESIARDADGEELRLRVSDTGIGVTPDQQRRLFQPFIQADSNTTRTYGGTGLGLSICRRLAEKMGGEISMESEAGAGTVMTVRLRLPLADPAQLAVNEEARAGIAAHSETAAAGLLGASILIADDHPINLRLIERQASLLGFDTTLAHDGVEALEKWKNGRFKLILTDCHMPRMDGYDLAREIRRIEAAGGSKKPIPIIACTANAMESDANACYEAGMNDYLSKPTTLDTLKAKIEHWITGDASVNAATAAETAAETLPEPVPVAADEAPLDTHTLAEFTGGDDSLRREILLQFIASNDADTLELRAALAGTDCEAIAKAAHRVKGASRMIGAQPYANVAERIERAARAGEHATVAGCVSDFEREASRLAAYLHTATSDA